MEYKIITVANEIDLEQQLNKLAKDGWRYNDCTVIRNGFLIVLSRSIKTSGIASFYPDNYEVND